MIFWNTKSLALSLREGTLTQRESFKYFLGGTILSLLQFQLLLSLGAGGFSYQSLIYGAVNILIVTIGSIFVFKTNSTGDNKNFIERFICISFPVNIQIFLLRGFGYFLYLILLGAAMNVPNFWISQSTLFYGHTIFGYVTLFIFYFLVNKNIAITAISGTRI